jgi:predicted transcriptional regulator
LFLDALLVVDATLQLLKELRDEIITPVKELAQSHGRKVTN